MMRKREYSLIIKSKDMKDYPLSYQQERLLYMSKLSTSSNVWNRVSAVYLHGRLDVDALYKTMEAVSRQYPILNNAIRYFQGEYRQFPGAIGMLKVITCPAGMTKEEIVNAVYQEKVDVVGGPLFFAYYYLMGEDDSMVVFKFHHIISDAHSFTILWNLFKLIYNRVASGGLIPEEQSENIRFYDYAVWMRQEFTEEKTSDRRSYWFSKFTVKTHSLNMQADSISDQDEIFRGTSVSVTLTDQFAKKIEKLCLINKTIPFVFYLGAYFLVLGKYSSQEDIVVGTMFSGRHYEKALMNEIGFFVNTVAIRSQIDRKYSVKEYLNYLLETVNDAFYMQDYPLDRVVKLANTDFNEHINPLYQALFNYIHDEYGTEKFLGIDEEIRVKPRIDSTQSPIMLDVHDNQSGLEISVEYFTSLFSAEFMQRWLDNYIHILNQMSEGWEQSLYSLDFICDKEKSKILNEFTSGPIYDRGSYLVHTLFEEQAIKAPDRIAISADGADITYHDLNRRADAIAQYLQAAGLSRGDRVAIYMDGKPDLIASIYGVLKAGGAYVPIEHTYPQNRIVRVLVKSGASYLLTDQERDFGSVPLKMILVDEIRNDECAEKIVSAGRQQDLAYVIFTSGSTGEPKGVMIEHHSLINVFFSIRDRINLREDDVTLALTSFSFDLFVVETLLPLSFGLRVVMTDENIKKSGRMINKVIMEEGVTLLQMTPSRMKVQMNISATKEILKRLRYIIFGGEVLPSSLLTDVRKYTDARIYNMYAPTETTVLSIGNDVTQGTNVSIGRPFDNVSVYLLNQYYELQPIGVYGQLCISGSCLARGYIGQEALTAERFVANPYISGERMYQTGDYGKWMEDGSIQFMGRMDQQVKLNGYRIELVEIEETLMLCDSIKAAVAVIHTDAKGIQRLVAYVIVNDKEQFSMEKANQSLSKWLPAYMFPSNYILMDDFPLNSNGKVDKAALPKPEFEEDTEEKTGQESCKTELSDTERELLAIAERLLEVKNLSIEDNFFLKGGSSILTMLFAAEIEETFDVQINILEFIELPVLSQIAKYIHDRK